MSVTLHRGASHESVLVSSWASGNIMSQDGSVEWGEPIDIDHFIFRRVRFSIFADYLPRELPAPAESSRQY